MSVLKEMDACEPGQKWADAQKDYRTAWETCRRGDWMLWVAAEREINIRTLTGAKAECGGLVEHLMKDDRSVDALRVAERFAEGSATAEELSLAAACAYRASFTSAAAEAAAYAAGAAASAANVATCAAYAAAAYAGVAAGEVEPGAADNTLKECADIVRKWIKFEDLGV